MVEISDLADNLTQAENGFWVAKNQRGVSYPAEGNQACFEVEDRSFWFNHRNDIIADLVQAFPPSGTVFDVGGGNGYVSIALQQAGVDVALVEPGPQGVRNARIRGLKCVIQSSLEDVGFKRESIAAFGLFDVLEHIEQEQRFLGILHDYLRGEGRLYLTVPAFNGLWSFDDELAGHYRRYTVGKLKKSLESAGFRLLFCSYFFWVLLPPIFLFRCVPSWFRFRKACAAERTQHEHSAPGGIAGRFLKSSLAFEAKRIRKRRRMPFGSSCIAVADKKA